MLTTRVQRKMANNLLGLYIHIPFCFRKCPYCDFYSVKHSPEKEQLYVDAVIRNLKSFKPQKLCIDTVYFGGGTPSVLNPKNLEKILNAVTENFNIAENPEITLECNPATIKEFSPLRSIGINRLSFGIQSCVDSELKTLGRLHNYSEAEKTVFSAFESGFENISCDLMIGTVGQTMESLVYSIDTLSRLPVKHISAYMLKIEPSTPYNRPEIINSVPDEDTTADFYLETVSRLKSHSFLQYEISNFAVKGFESRHNLKYWNCDEYIGIGCSAHSYFNNVRYAVPRDIESFINSPVQKTEITDSAPNHFEEKAMLRLRLCDGFDFSEFPEESDHVIKKAEQLEKYGLVKINGNFISLTPEGFLVSNSIIEEIIFE